MWTSLVAKEVLNGDEITDIKLEEELKHNGDDTIVGYDYENNYLVYFNDTKRTYKVDKDGNITQLENAPSLITETIYVTLYSDGILAFSSNNETDNTKNITKKYTVGMNDIYTNNDMVPWKNEQSIINKVIFINEIRPTSTKRWFRNCINLVKLENIQKLKTSQVLDMSMMFSGCRKLTTLDLSSFDTRRVKDMSEMFSSIDEEGNSGNGMLLNSLNISNFDTTNVKKMSNMFYYCSKLKNIDVRSFNTKNVTKMNGMFKNCFELISIDISNFDTSKVTDMGEMFGADNPGSVTQSIMLLNEIKGLNNFNTSKVTNMYGMFNGCVNLEYIDVSSFDTSNSNNIAAMFSRCIKLKSINVGDFNTKNVKSMGWLFDTCSAIENIDLSKFNTQKVTDMRYMFNKCDSLKMIYVGDEFTLSNVTQHEKMFNSCNNLIGGNGTTYNSGRIDKTYARIDGGPTSSTPGYFTYKSNN